MRLAPCCYLPDNQLGWVQCHVLERADLLMCKIAVLTLIVLTVHTVQKTSLVRGTRSAWNAAAQQLCIEMARAAAVPAQRSAAAGSRKAKSSMSAPCSFTDELAQLLACTQAAN